MNSDKHGRGFSKDRAVGLRGSISSSSTPSQFKGRFLRPNHPVDDSKTKSRFRPPSSGAVVVDRRPESVTSLCDFPPPRVGEDLDFIISKYRRVCANAEYLREEIILDDFGTYYQHLHGKILDLSSPWKRFLVKEFVQNALALVKEQNHLQPRALSRLGDNLRRTQLNHISRERYRIKNNISIMIRKRRIEGDLRDALLSFIKNIQVPESDFQEIQDMFHAPKNNKPTSDNSKFSRSTDPRHAVFEDLSSQQGYCYLAAFVDTKHDPHELKKTFGFNPSVNQIISCLLRAYDDEDPLLPAFTVVGLNQLHVNMNRFMRLSDIISLYACSSYRVGMSHPPAPRKSAELQQIAEAVAHLGINVDAAVRQAGATLIEDIITHTPEKLVSALVIEEAKNQYDDFMRTIYVSQRNIEIQELKREFPAFEIKYVARNERSSHELAKIVRQIRQRIFHDEIMYDVNYLRPNGQPYDCHVREVGGNPILLAQLDLRDRCHNCMPLICDRDAQRNAVIRDALAKLAKEGRISSDWCHYLPQPNNEPGDYACANFAQVCPITARHLYFGFVHDMSLLDIMQTLDVSDCMTAVVDIHFDPRMLLAEGADKKLGSFWNFEERDAVKEVIYGFVGETNNNYRHNFVDLCVLATTGSFETPEGKIFYAERKWCLGTLTLKLTRVLGLHPDSLKQLSITDFSMYFPADEVLVVYYDYKPSGRHVRKFRFVSKQFVEAVLLYAMRMGSNFDFFQLLSFAISATKRIIISGTEINQQNVDIPPIELAKIVAALYCQAFVARGESLSFISEFINLQKHLSEKMSLYDYIKEYCARIGEAISEKLPDSCRFLERCSGLLEHISYHFALIKDARKHKLSRIGAEFFGRVDVSRAFKAMRIEAALSDPRYATSHWADEVRRKRAEFRRKDEMARAAARENGDESESDGEKFDAELDDFGFNPRFRKNIDYVTNDGVKQLFKTTLNAVKEARGIDVDVAKKLNTERLREIFSLKHGQPASSARDVNILRVSKRAIRQIRKRQRSTVVRLPLRAPVKPDGSCVLNATLASCGLFPLVDGVAYTDIPKNVFRYLSYGAKSFLGYDFSSTEHGFCTVVGETDLSLLEPELNSDPKTWLFMEFAQLIGCMVEKNAIAVHDKNKAMRAMSYKFDKNFFVYIMGKNKDHMDASVVDVDPEALRRFMYNVTKIVNHPTVNKHLNEVQPVKSDMFDGSVINGMRKTRSAAKCIEILGRLPRSFLPQIIVDAGARDYGSATVLKHKFPGAFIQGISDPTTSGRLPEDLVDDDDYLDIPANIMTIDVQLKADLFYCDVAHATSWENNQPLETILLRLDAYLAKGGAAVLKIPNILTFDSRLLPFQSVELFKPFCSKKTSTECYAICQGYDCGESHLNVRPAVLSYLDTVANACKHLFFLEFFGSGSTGNHYQQRFDPPPYTVDRLFEIGAGGPENHQTKSDSIDTLDVLIERILKDPTISLDDLESSCVEGMKAYLKLPADKILALAKISRRISSDVQEKENHVAHLSDDAPSEDHEVFESMVGSLESVHPDQQEKVSYESSRPSVSSGCGSSLASLDFDQFLCPDEKEGSTRSVEIKIFDIIAYDRPPMRQPVVEGMVEKISDLRLAVSEKYKLPINLISLRQNGKVLFDHQRLSCLDVESAIKCEIDLPLDPGKKHEVMLTSRKYPELRQKIIPEVMKNVSDLKNCLSSRINTTPDNIVLYHEGRVADDAKRLHLMMHTPVFVYEDKRDSLSATIIDTCDADTNAIRDAVGAIVSTVGGAIKKVVNPGPVQSSAPNQVEFRFGGQTVKIKQKKRKTSKHTVLPSTTQALGELKTINENDRIQRDALSEQIRNKPLELTENRTKKKKKKGRARLPSCLSGSEFSSSDDEDAERTVEEEKFREAFDRLKLGATKLTEEEKEMIKKNTTGPIETNCYVFTTEKMFEGLVLAQDHAVRLRKPCFFAVDLNDSSAILDHLARQAIVLLSDSSNKKRIIKAIQTAPTNEYQVIEHPSSSFGVPVTVLTRKTFGKIGSRSTLIVHSNDREFLPHLNHITSASRISLVEDSYFHPIAILMPDKDQDNCVVNMQRMFSGVDARTTIIVRVALNALEETIFNYIEAQADIMQNTRQTITDYNRAESVKVNPRDISPHYLIDDPFVENRTQASVSSVKEIAKLYELLEDHFKSKAADVEKFVRRNKIIDDRTYVYDNRRKKFLSRTDNKTVFYPDLTDYSFGFWGGRSYRYVTAREEFISLESLVDLDPSASDEEVVDRFPADLVIVFDDTRLFLQTETGPILQKIYDRMQEKGCEYKTEGSWIDGVPGAGKTYYITNKADLETDAILCTTKAGTTEMRERFLKKSYGMDEEQALKFLRYYQDELSDARATKNNRLIKELVRKNSFIRNVINRVRTITSCLMHVKRSSIEVENLFVDEALMSHFGTIAGCAWLLDAKKMILIGDQKQIPFHNRYTDLGCLKFAHPCVGTYLSDTLSRSYRCPIDVVYAFSDYYVNFHTMSKTVRSVGIMNDCHITKEMATEDTLFLTFTQEEKSQLKGLLLAAGISQEYIRKHVHTIAEAQGKTVKNTRLYRFKTNEIQIFSDPSQILVGMTRHTGTFEYYTKCPNDKVSERISKIPKDDAVLVQHNELLKDPASGRRPMGGPYLPDVRVDEEVSSALCHVPHSTHPILCYDDTSDEDESVKPLFAKMHRVGNVAALQTLQDELFPGASVIDRRGEQESVEDCGINANLMDVSIKPLLVRQRKFPKFDCMQPTLRTHMEQSRYPSGPELISGFMKRNGMAPQMTNGMLKDHCGNKVYDNFVKSVLDPEKMHYLQEYRENPIEFNPMTLQLWVNKQQNQKGVRKLIQNDTDFFERPHHLFDYMIKNTVKPALEYGKIQTYSAAQTIAYQHKSISSCWIQLMSLAIPRLTRLFKDKFMLYEGDSPENLEKKFNKKCDAATFKKCKVLEMDFSKFDKSQNFTHLNAECKLLELVGVDPELVAVWRRSHEQSVINSKDFGFRARLKNQRKSGDALTFNGNCLVTLMALVSIIDEKDITFCAVAGDDSIVAGNDMVARDFSMYFCDYHNFDSKSYYKYKYSYFCSKFLIVTDDWIHIVPDFIKLMVKIGRHDIRNKTHACEYRIALRDNAIKFKNKVVVDLLSEAVSERYKKNVDLSYAVEAFLNIIKSDKSFDSMYYHESWHKIITDPSRPSFKND